MKKKYPENKKKRKITLTINKEISELLDDYLIKNEIFNKSEFIEKIIKERLNDEH